jgi:chromosome segregation ATPase
LIIALIFTAGFIVAQIAYTSPVRSALEQVSTEKTQLQEKLASVQDELAASQNDLEGKTAELTVTQSDLRTAESTIEQLKSNEIFNRNLDEIKYHVALARIALLNQDKLTARQALNLAQDDLDELSPLLKADNLQAVKQRLADAYALSIADIGKALEELRTLTENLERIPVK